MKRKRKLSSACLGQLLCRCEHDIYMRHVAMMCDCAYKLPGHESLISIASGKI